MKKIKKIFTMFIIAALLFSVIPAGAVPAYAKKTVKVSSIKLNKSVYTLKKGKTFRLKATYTPADTTQKKILWKTSNKKVVTISKNGKIKAKKKGTATITAMVKGTKIKARCKVYVGTPVTGISLAAGAKTMEKGSTFHLNAKVQPKKATVRALAYSSSDSKVASVSKTGLITARKAGTCRITVQAKDGTGKKKTVRITVSEKKTAPSGKDKEENVPAEDDKTVDDAGQKPSTSITSDDFASLSADRTEFSTDDKAKDIVFTIKTSLVSDRVYVLGSNGDMITLNDAGYDGDLLARDGEYTGSYTLDEERENLEGISYKGYAAVGSQALKTNEITVSVINPISDEEIDLMSDFDEGLVHLLSSSGFQAKDIPERKSSALEYLKAREGKDIVPGSVSYDSASYSFSYEYLAGSGIPGKAVIYEEKNNLKGRGEEDSPEPSEKKMLKAFAVKADEGDYISDDKKNIVVLHNFSNSGTSTSSDERDWINKYNEHVSNALGSVSNINTIVGATVENYKNLQDYDAIIINSHGAYDSLEKDPEICLRQLATAALDKAYDFDLQMNRIHRVNRGNGTFYWLRPAFFTFYYPDRELDGSIVYLGCCLSYGNKTIDQDMAIAWHIAGADAIYAYVNEVIGTYDYDMLEMIFSRLAVGQSASQALAAAQAKYGITDGGSPEARLYLYELSDTYLIRGIMNGGFDGSDNLPSLARWTAKGDVRAVSSLGGITPASQNGMAFISTGIGSDEGEMTSSLSQTVKIPGSVSRITFTYDMISEEPMEYVGSEYNDDLTLRICDTDGTVLENVQLESINSSTWYSLEGINLPGGDTTIYHTRWKEDNIDVSAYHGKVISLKFIVNDVGDSSYDSVVLLDDVTME